MNARGTSTRPSKEGHGPLRQCVVTRQTVPQHALLRLALGPDGEPYVDVLGRAPGRGVYVTCEPQLLRDALSPKGLGRAFRGRAQPVPTTRIEEMIQDAIARMQSRILEMMGIARRAGLLEVGMDPVLRALKAAPSGAFIILSATDFGAASTRKLQGAVANAKGRGLGVQSIHLGSKQDFGSRLGRGDVGVVAIRPSRHAGRMTSEVARWLALRGESSKSPEIPLTDEGHGEQSKGGSVAGTSGVEGEVNS